MANLPLKILLLTKYSKRGASSRLRTLQYIPYLKSHGLSVTASNFFDDAYLREFHFNSKRSIIRVLKSYIKRLFILLTFFKCDIIWIEKEIFPYFPSFFEQFLKFVGKTFIVDYDDAIFHNYDLSRNFVLKNLMSKKIFSVMKYADCVISGNKYIADYAKIAGASRIEVIPTVVDSLKYDPKKNFLNKSPIIGWIGSRSTQKYLLSIQEVLSSICKIYGARLLLVGATSEIAHKFSDINVDIIPWSEEEESRLIRLMDIGIMPLSNGPWEKGKCGYKLIQYMASGVPTIASSVGANIDIIRNSNCGFLVDSNDEWKNALMNLLDNREQCIRLGNAGRLAVENIYSSRVQAPKIKKIFFDVIKSKKLNNNL